MIRWIKPLSGAFLALGIVPQPHDAFAGQQAIDPIWLANASGAELIDASIKRHRLAGGVSEALTMIVTDHSGHRQSNKFEVFRMDGEDGSRNYHLRFSAPPELAGVTVNAKRLTNGLQLGNILLPALGQKAVTAELNEGHPPLPGSDLLLQDFDTPSPALYRIERLRDRRVDGVQHLVVDLQNNDADGVFAFIRLELLAETLSIVRTTHFDSSGKVLRVRSNHDLRQTERGAWWPAVIHIRNQSSGQETLIRVEGRQVASDTPSELVPFFGTGLVQPGEDQQ